MFGRRGGRGGLRGCCRLLDLKIEVSAGFWFLLGFVIDGWGIASHGPPTKPFTVFWARDTWMLYWRALSVEEEVVVEDRVLYAAVAKSRIVRGRIAGVGDGAGGRRM